MKKNTLNWMDIIFAIGTIVFALIAMIYAMSPDAKCAVTLMFMAGIAYVSLDENFDEHLDQILDKIYPED